MASDAPLQRTPIEYYVFAAGLVVLNIVGLLATGHTLPASFSMGLFFGFFQATIILLIVVTLRLVLGGSGGSDAESAE